MTEQFCCPRCNGRSYGANHTGQRWCNSDTAGQPLSARRDEKRQPVAGTTGVPCGWQSKDVAEAASV